jgi:aminoglycoside phosphotransferase family enzyme/predicted kinase
VVLFVGDRAYKVKKQVDLTFLDFRTVEARERACRRELDLNRRLSPDVYLDLLRVSDSTGATRDWVVVMRRMPAARRLSTLVRNGVDVRQDLRELARMLAAFHARADRGPEVLADGRQQALRQRWTDNLTETAPFVGAVLDQERFDEIADLALRYVDGRGRLLDERVRDGFVVDGHGDLLAEDIFCLVDGPRVLDCLEFDDALRHVDGLDDAAFLAMDLERLGVPDLATRFLRWYDEFTGGPAPTSLTHHYLAYRAFVRVKVACLRYEQGATEARADARRLASLAWRHLRQARVTLVLVGGLPGTGKSTVASALADRTGCVLLRSDLVRRELPETSSLDPHAGYRRGRYAPRHVHATYQELLDRATALLERGESVILDASWSSADERAAAREVARRTVSDPLELRCEAPLEVTRPRLAARVGDPSDATVDVALRMAEDFAPWPEATTIDTSGSVERAVRAALAATS